MDLPGALPDRCVICNGGAGGYRLSRTLYWSPAAWRFGAIIAPFVALCLGLATDVMALVVAFWPLVLILLIANFFVRKKLVLELGLCPPHRRMRTVLGVLSVAGMAGVVASWPAFVQDPALGEALLLGSIAALLSLAALQSYLGIHAVSLKSLSDEHAWLSRTGKAFRAALPELPG
jgi:hypothetical protein